MKIVSHRLRDDFGAPLPYVETANLGGDLVPRLLVLHYTAGPSIESAIGVLTKRRYRYNVSAHVVIGRDGEVVQLASMDRVTWHAGKSRWRQGELELTNLNTVSIGVELVNAGPLDPCEGGNWQSWWGGLYPEHEVVKATHRNGGPHTAWMHYPHDQLASTYQVAKAVVDHYAILDVVGHDEVAPGRKFDPGPVFPMEEFRRRIFAEVASNAMQQGARDASGPFFVSAEGEKQ